MSLLTVSLHLDTHHGPLALQRWLLACVFLVSQINKAAVSSAAGASAAESQAPGAAATADKPVAANSTLPDGASIRLLKRAAPSDTQLNLFLIVDV